MDCPKQLLIEVDLVQAEWVVTAYFSGDRNMIDVVENKKDAHIVTAKLISGAPEEFIKLEKDIVGGETDPTVINRLRKYELSSWLTRAALEGWFLPRSMSLRQAGKKSNHGLNYNMGYLRFAMENEVDNADGKRCWAAYRDVAYPGLKDMWRAVDTKLRIDRTLTTCHGDKRRFLGYWDQRLLDQAYAFIPQATVGRVTNRGLRAIYHSKAPCLKRYDPLANVHDSIPGQAFPRSWEELHEICTTLSGLMEVPCSYHGRDFILRRDVKIGRNWRDMAEVVNTNDPIWDLERTWGDALSKAS